MWRAAGSPGPVARPETNATTPWRDATEFGDHSTRTGGSADLVGGVRESWGDSARKGCDDGGRGTGSAGSARVEGAADRAPGGGGGGDGVARAVAGDVPGSCGAG